VIDIKTRKAIKEHNGVKIESYSKYLDAEYTRLTVEDRKKIKDTEDDLAMKKAFLLEASLRFFAYEHSQLTAAITYVQKGVIIFLSTGWICGPVYLGLLP
jgi:hypothetical protein